MRFSRKKSVSQRIVKLITKGLDLLLSISNVQWIGMSWLSLLESRKLLNYLRCCLSFALKLSDFIIGFCWQILVFLNTNIFLPKVMLQPLHIVYPMRKVFFNPFQTFHTLHLSFFQFQQILFNTALYSRLNLFIVILQVQFFLFVNGLDPLRCEFFTL